MAAIVLWGAAFVSLTASGKKAVLHPGGSGLVVV